MLQKYPNSLGRQVDPVDIQVQYVIKSTDNNVSNQRITLSPEDVVFDVLDRFFSNGTMDISDAFLISTSNSNYEGLSKTPSHVSGLNISNSGFNSGPEQQARQSVTLGPPIAGQQSIESPSYNTSFAVPKVHTGEHAKTNSSGSFIKSIPSHGPRDSDGGSSSHSSMDSPKGFEARTSLDSPRESSASPTTNTVYQFPAANNHTTPQANFQFPAPGPSSTGHHISINAPDSAISINTNANGIHGQGSLQAGAQVKRSASQIRDKSGNGVILLPRQSKYPNTSTGSRKTGATRLSADMNNLKIGASGGSSHHKDAAPEITINDENAIPTGSHKSRPKTPSPKEEIHHTKSGAYQRVVKPTAAAHVGDTAEAHKEETHSEDAKISQTDKDASAKKDDGRLKDKKPSTLPKPNASRLSPSSAHSGKAPSSQLTVRSATSRSRSPANDVHKNSINNNRKLLLSINKGISPYTTVVPQINVLIVEDNVINQKILETFLRKRKIRSSTAKNGKEAIEKWQKGGFHLVLMDIQLPVMSGITATKRIRQLEHQNRIGVFSSAGSEGASTEVMKPEEILDTKLFRSPIIIVALTASSSVADKSEALAAGCNDFLTKPVNLKWLEQKTIEWGCMQALIDFEGWKHWVSKDLPAVTTTTSRPSSGRKSLASSMGRPNLERLTSSSNIRRAAAEKTSTAPSARDSSAPSHEPAQHKPTIAVTDTAPSNSATIAGTQSKTEASSNDQTNQAEKSFLPTNSTDHAMADTKSTITN